MDYKSILTGLLSKAYKMDNGKIAELLQDGEDVDQGKVLDELLNFDASRVDNIKKTIDTSGKFQEGYAKAKKEVREDFEKEIKEKYQIESDKIGTDLIDSVLTDRLSKVETKGKLTDDDVKRHPVFQDLESRYKTDIKAKENEWMEKVNEIQNQHKTEKTFSVVRNKGLQMLDSLNPVLPTNAEIAGNQKNWFLNALKDYEFDLQENDRIVVMKDGKVVTDQHGNSLDFPELIKGTASKFFEFQQNNGGANSGNGNEGVQQGSNSNGYPAGIAKPKNLEELNSILRDTKIDLSDRQKVAETYEKENSN